MTSLIVQLVAFLFKSLRMLAVIQTSESPRLRNPTTKPLSVRSPPHTSTTAKPLVSRLILQPCLPRGSWLTAMSSQLPRIVSVSLEMLSSEQPISKGAFNMHHSEKCAQYSSCVMPPLPTSSISGSFHPPLAAYFSSPTCWSRMPMKDFQLSEMSPVVRQELARGPAHSQDFSCPQLHMEQKMGLPLSLRALDMARQRNLPLWFLLQQLSYFRQSTLVLVHEYSHAAQVFASMASQPSPPGLP